MSDLYLSEIFPLAYSELNIASFRLSPEIDIKIGNSLGWYLSKEFPDLVVIWEKGYFWLLGKPNITFPEKNKLQEKIELIQSQHQDKFGKRNYFVQWVNNPEITASVIANLAVRVIKIDCSLTREVIFTENRVQVKRECNFWSEVYRPNNNLVIPAITIHPKSFFLHQETLDIFFDNHPERNNPEKLLIGLQVRDIENNSNATIVGLNGTIEESRDKLIACAKGALSREKLQTAPPKQPVVSVQFGQNSDIYDYAMAALCPAVNAYTSYKFDVEYGVLQKQAKITYIERKKLLEKYRKELAQTLINYGLSFRKLCINSSQPYKSFWIPQQKLEDTPLLFGNSVTHTKTVTGLSKGGVYSRHEEFQNPARKIRLAILNLSSMKAIKFFYELEKKLAKFQFKVSLSDENIATDSVENLTETEAKAKVQALLNQIMQVPVDLVLVFLPESDRGEDDSDGSSLYSFASRHLLRRKIASQVIYQKTLNQRLNNVLNNIVPGILAKLGNLPFVLAEPLSIADYFLGLDISRRKKKNGTGSINACACVRWYGKQGEFIKYQLADDSSVEGEEIPKRILQDFLPMSKFQNKTVLIYRDGRFRGDEIKHLVAWSKAIKTKLILVECAKSQIPRLYNVSHQKLQQPTKGLALKLSVNEAILVTTQVSEKVGVPRPLRLKVRNGENEGISVDIEKLLETTLKLTLLHHGSLKDPRLPIPLFGADKIAYRRLQGIYPGELEGDKQYWL